MGPVINCQPMSVIWPAEQRGVVEEGMAKHPVSSGRCAALARVVQVAAGDAELAHEGLFLQPKWPAPYLPTKHGTLAWHHHVVSVVETDCVDAFTGADGFARAEYLHQFFDDVAYIEQSRVDVSTIDPNIELDP